MGLTHEELKSMLAPYAIGAVTHDEMRVLRGHILTCEECMAEADELADAAAYLTLAVEEEPLPAGFADRLLGIVEADRPAPAPIRRRAFGWRSLVASGALAVTLLATGLYALDSKRELDRSREALLAVLHSEGGLELDGAGAITARLVPTSGGSLFVATGLDEPPDAHTYQLWLMRDGKPVSGGTFSVEEGLAVLETSDRLTGIEGAAVTIEPEGGSRAPTSDPLMSSA